MRDFKRLDLGDNIKTLDFQDASLSVNGIKIMISFIVLSTP